MLAYTIYITGTRKFLPDEGKVSSNYQRDAFNDATAHFMKRESSSSTSSSSSSSSVTTSSAASSSQRKDILGARKAEFIHGHLYINIHNEEEKSLLEDLFLNPVIHVGEVVAGDEKLFHYTAHHMNTKAVPQKKDVSFQSSFSKFIFICTLGGPLDI